MNNSDKWIEEYLIPKLISDGKIRLSGVDTLASNNTLASDDDDIVKSCKGYNNDNDTERKTSKDDILVNGSDGGVGVVSTSDRWNGNNKNGNNVEIKSLNIKPLSVDGFMLSAPCKVEIECIDKRNPKCVNKFFLVVKVSKLLCV